MSELALKLIAENKKTKAPFLDLGNCGLVNYIPKELEDCFWLKAINFGNQYCDHINFKWITSKNTEGSNIFTGREFVVLAKLSDLQSLELGFNQISDISFLEKLSNLQSLDLNENQIVDYSILSVLNSLQLLDLSSNQISDYSFLEKLSSLHSLGLRFNQISDIGFLEKLSSLQSLDLRFSQISDISLLAKLTGLRSIYLSFNRISDYSFLEKLRGLQSLELRFNQILNINFLEKLSGLQLLDLSINQISDISFLEKLSSLQSLKLSKNQISDISFLEKLSGLQSLDLSENQISDISSLAQLNVLQSLYLSSNQISDISFLEKLSSLQSLVLGSNQISDIGFLEKLSSLQSLELGSNQISDISFLEKLSSLQSLELGSNQISNISSLEKLSGLKSLNLSFNRISDIQSIKVICYLNRIEDIDFANNPLPFPESLDLSDLSEIRTYFNDSERGTTSKRSVKLLFMGDGCAGKSTLYQHLKTGNSPQEIDVNDRTHGIALDIWSSAMPDIDLKVWDFGGQDIFHSTHRLFLGQRAIYVLVWTKQSNKKCTEGEQHPLRYWLDFIADYGKESTVLLVENIINGQFDSSEFPDDKNLDQLVVEYKSKGILLDITHNRIDCKYGTREVKNFKSTLQNKIEDLLEDYPIQDFPANWYAVQEKLEELRIVNKTVAWNEYQAICDFNNISNAKALIYYLDRSGVVSYYPNLFKNQVILQTDWILEAMYSFLKLKDNQFMRLQGKLIDEDFVSVWQAKYTLEEQALFKSYMLKSEVMAKPKDMYKVNVERNYQYLIPALFPVCKPHDKIKWNNEVKYLALQFKFVYNAIIQRLQVRVLNYCHVEEEESLYQNRISFTDKQGKTAHIELLETEKELRIWAEYEELYNDILKELNDIYPLDRLKIIERNKDQEDKIITYQKNFDKEHGFNKNIFMPETIEIPKPIKIFVTYCWTDKDGEIDEEHQKKVRAFTNELISYEDFDATFDLYENEKSTATNFIRMMYENIKSSKKVIVVLSEGYAQKADVFSGGVGKEFQAIMNDIEANPRKYVLVSFDKRSGEIYPFGLQGTDTLVIKNGNLELAENQEDLNRLFAKLKDKAIYVMPEKGFKKAVVKKK